MTKETVGGLLAALHEERVRSWDPAALKANVDQRRRLIEQAAQARFVTAGDTVDPFTLTEVDGRTLTLDELRADGPVVLLFFRYAGCPACNIALPHYDRHLAPALKALGARLVAVSPQVAERLVEIKRTHGLGFEVATDRDNTLGRRFGILYEPDEDAKAAALSAGRFIGEATGTGTWELPQPAIVVIGRDAVVYFADVSPDWMVRTEAEPVLEAVRALGRSKAA